MRLCALHYLIKEVSSEMLLKEWRWENCFNQTELAAVLGVSQPELSRVERGDFKSVKLKKKFLEKFGRSELNKIQEFKEE